MVDQLGYDEEEETLTTTYLKREHIYHTFSHTCEYYQIELANDKKPS